MAINCIQDEGIIVFVKLYILVKIMTRKAPEECDHGNMKLVQMTWHFLSGKTRAPIAKCLLYECSVTGWVSVVVLTCSIFTNIGDAVPCPQFS